MSVASVDCLNLGRSQNGVLRNRLTVAKTDRGTITMEICPTMICSVQIEAIICLMQTHFVCQL